MMKVLREHRRLPQVLVPEGRLLLVGHCIIVRELRGHAELRTESVSPCGLCEVPDGGRTTSISALGNPSGSKSGVEPLALF